MFPASGAWQPKTKWPIGVRPRTSETRACSMQIETHPAVFLRVVGRPQLHLPDHRPLLLDHREHRPEILPEEFGLQRDEFLLHELPHHPDHRLHLLRYGEIHYGLLNLM